MLSPKLRTLTSFTFFVLLCDRLQQLESIRRDRSQIAAATRMASNLKEAVLFQSYASNIRSEKSYLEILTPTQTILYQEWLSNNRDRLSQHMQRRRASKNLPTSSTTPAVDNACLMDVCRKLEDVLRISKGGSNSSSRNRSGDD